MLQITGTQCRMGRAALAIGVRDLAAQAKVSPTTILRLEAGEELKPRTIEAIQATLEIMGVRFVEDGVLYVPAARSAEAPSSGETSSSPGPISS